MASQIDLGIRIGVPTPPDIIFLPMASQIDLQICSGPTDENILHSHDGRLRRPLAQMRSSADILTFTDGPLSSSSLFPLSSFSNKSLFQLMFISAPHPNCKHSGSFIIILLTESPSARPELSILPIFFCSPNLSMGSVPFLSPLGARWGVYSCIDRGSWTCERLNESFSFWAPPLLKILPFSPHCESFSSHLVLLFLEGLFYVI